MKHGQRKIIEINNYGLFAIVRFLFQVTLLGWILYYIGIKYWCTFNFIVLSLFLLSISFIAINNMASLQILGNEICVKHKIRKSRDLSLKFDEIYLTLYNPPGATLSQELVQIRLKRNKNLIYSFGKDTESKNNINIYKLLIRNGLKAKRLLL